MLDYRLKTFIVLCEVMNYRKTAEILNMTQPAVTQHIHFLESKYECKLFLYYKKCLKKTDKGIILERFARSMFYNELEFINEIKKPEMFKLNLGATKTIGDYVINKRIIEFLKNENHNLKFVIDNTQNLLRLLDENKLDFAIIEGFFDRGKYNSKLFKKENFIGFCSKNHRFANKEVEFNELFDENLIIREKGSGTREIFEMVLRENNYSIKEFKKRICISSFNIIKQLVKENIGISFAYEAIYKEDVGISTFTIKNVPMTREFNYVYLQNIKIEEKLTLF